MNWCVLNLHKFYQIFSNKLYNFYIEFNWLYFVNFDPINVANNLITNLKQLLREYFNLI